MRLFLLSLEGLFDVFKPLSEIEGAPHLRLLILPHHSPRDRAYRGRKLCGTSSNIHDIGIEGDLYDTRSAQSYLQIIESSNSSSEQNYGIWRLLQPKIRGFGIDCPLVAEHAAC